MREIEIQKWGDYGLDGHVIVEIETKDIFPPGIEDELYLLGRVDPGTLQIRWGCRVRKPEQFTYVPSECRLRRDVPVP